MKIISRLMVVAGLALAANAASALPLQVSVATVAAFGGSAGSWTLASEASSPVSRSWLHGLEDQTTWTVDIGPGDYRWSISGLLLGLGGGAVGWELVLDGNLIYRSLDATADVVLKIKDKHTFDVVGVPEPATLTLLGLGLGVIGLATRRRSVRLKAAA